MEPRKHYFAKIPTIAIFIVMAMSGPLGVLLFILKGIDQKVQKEEQEAARTRGDYRPAPNPAPLPKTPPFPGQDVPTAEQKSAKEWHKNIAVLCTIMGAVFLFAGVTDAVDVISVWKFWPDPGELFSNIAMAIGGGGALLTGLRMNRTRKLEQLLDKVVGERDNIPLPELFAAIRRKYPGQLFMADCSTYEDASAARDMGFDIVGTTLRGYTRETAGTEIPDMDLIARLGQTMGIPVIAEGGIWTPQQLHDILSMDGIHAAVIGGAITRPLEITKRFVQAIES